MQSYYGKNKCKHQGHRNKKDIDSTVLPRWREEVKENSREHKCGHIANKRNNK